MENSRFADVNGEITITAAYNTGYSLVFYCGTIDIVNTFGSVLAEFDADDIPAADVAPVVHGEWIHNTKREYDYICSVCRGDAPEDRYRNNAILTPYCPHCGAVMDGGEKG